MTSPAPAALADKSTVIVLPTYNERENLTAMHDAIAEKVPGAHLLIVDDNSPDGTGKIADELAGRRGREVSVLHRAGKEGLGRAYLAGFAKALQAGYQRIVQMDCDFSHPVDAVPRLLAALDAGADVAVGSRWVKGGGTVNWGLGRKIISRGGSFYARTVLGVPYRDVTAGFKAWKRTALEKIPLQEVSAQGYGFQVEMCYRAHRLGLKIVEIPITFVDRRVGQSKMSKKIVLEAMAICWRLRSQL